MLSAGSGAGLQRPATVRLTLRRQKRTAGGGWSKGRPVGPEILREDRQSPEFTCAADWHISALLRACIKPWDNSRKPVLEPEALATLLQTLAETGRCYWGDGDIPLMPGEACPLQLDWQLEGDHRRLVARLGARPLAEPDIYLIHSACPMCIEPQAG